MRAWCVTAVSCATCCRWMGSPIVGGTAEGLCPREGEVQWRTLSDVLKYFTCYGGRAVLRDPGEQLWDQRGEVAGIQITGQHSEDMDRRETSQGGQSAPAPGVCRQSGMLRKLLELRRQLGSSFVIPMLLQDLIVCDLGSVILSEVTLPPASVQGLSEPGLTHPRGQKTLGQNPNSYQAPQLLQAPASWSHPALGVWGRPGPRES